MSPNPYCPRCNAHLEGVPGNGSRVIHEPSCPLVAKPIAPVIFVTAIIVGLLFWFMFLQSRGLS